MISETVQLRNYTTEVNERNKVFSHGQSSAKPRLFFSGIQANSDAVGLDVSVFTILYSYRFTKRTNCTGYTVRKAIQQIKAGSEV